MTSKLILSVRGLAVAAWIAPALAMVFTDTVEWSPFDFAVFGALLLAAVASFELLTRKGLSATYRLASGLAVLAAFFTIWANLAVGIVGSEAESINLLFFGVLLVAAVGAALSRFEAAGMAVAMLATGIAQLLAAVIVWMSGIHAEQLLILAQYTAAMLVIWSLSAALFLRAAR